jgi:DNA-binding FrmR family transcriptional regulator
MNHQECNDHNHPSHEAQLPRLNRIAGQVEGIKKMINERRYCPDILVQLHAIRSAVRNLEIQILDAHLSHCVTETFAQQNQEDRLQKIEEIRQIIKRFE